MPVTQQQIAEVIEMNKIRFLVFIRSIVCDLHSAEDVFQRVCLSAVESSDKYNDIQHLSNWMWQTSRYESIQELQKRKKRPLLLDNHTIEMLELELQKPSMLDHAEILFFIERCMAMLSSSARLLLEKRYHDNMTAATLAKMLNRNVESVYVSLSRAHHMLNACVHRQINLTERQ